MLSPYSVNVMEQVNVDEREIPPLVIKTLPQPCDRKRLTRGAADQQLALNQQFLGPLAVLAHVAEIRNVWVMVGQHGRRERLNLAEREGSPSEAVPCGRRRFDARTDADVFHFSNSLRTDSMIG
jgi:hypothetical protein